MTLDLLEAAEKPLVIGEKSSRATLSHDEAVRTDEQWLASFRHDVARLFEDCHYPNQVCQRFNELYPEYDNRVSTASLDLSRAGELRKAQCVTGILCLGTWANLQGLRTYYFPRNYNHLVLAISEKELILPENLAGATFIDLVNRNPEVRLFEYRNFIKGSLSPNLGLHEINDFLLRTQYLNRKIYEAPQTTVEGAMRAIGWWQGKN